MFEMFYLDEAVWPLYNRLVTLLAVPFPDVSLLPSLNIQHSKTLFFQLKTSCQNESNVLPFFQDPFSSHTCIHCQSSWTQIAQSCSPVSSDPPVHQPAHQVLFSGQIPANPLGNGLESCLLRIAGAGLRSLMLVADLVSGKDLVLQARSWN